MGVALPLTASHNQDARAIARRDGITFFDALIISSAAQADCGTLLTEDMQAGRTISGVKIVNPFAN